MNDRILERPHLRCRVVHVRTERHEETLSGDNARPNEKRDQAHRHEPRVEKGHTESDEESKAEYMVAGNEEVLHEFQEHALRGVAVRITRNQLCNGGVRVLGQAGHVRELRVWVDHAIVADRVARNLKVAWPLALVEECLEAIPIGAILVRVFETIIHTLVHADHVVVCLLIRRKPCLFRALFEANNVEVLCQEVAIRLVQHRAIHPTNVTLIVNG
mmetsp:Transcript_20073/g.42299  ORF Transcript_20073/g.42299 Transcript_20073/m.42299 type:complete len:216 (-) Transcript_20073:461-1108(-)